MGSKRKIERSVEVMYGVLEKERKYKKKFKNMTNKRVSFRGRIYKIEEQVQLKELVFEKSKIKFLEKTRVAIGLKELKKLKPGDFVRFSAKVSEYEKGRLNYRDYVDRDKIEYKLSDVKDLEIIEEAV